METDSTIYIVSEYVPNGEVFGTFDSIRFDLICLQSAIRLMFVSPDHSSGSSWPSSPNWPLAHAILFAHFRTLVIVSAFTAHLSFLNAQTPVMTGVRAFIARATYSLDALHWTHFLVIESHARLVWCADLISWEPIERHSCTHAFECTWRGPAVQSRAARALQSEPLCCSRECHVKCLSALESMFTCVRIALPLARLATDERVRVRVFRTLDIRVSPLPPPPLPPASVVSRARCPLAALSTLDSTLDSTFD